LKFEQDDIWFQGLKCKNNHMFYHRNGISFHNVRLRLCDDYSNSNLLILIDYWLKETNEFTQSNINEQIKSFFVNYKKHIHTKHDGGT
jgi:hypothetical protein